MATILVVDDHPTNRKVITTLLGYQGHRLLEAADGEQALSLARAERPDLIIADVIMPSMDGYEFVRQLRAGPVGGATPVIFYTALAQEERAQILARACGVNHLLGKPSNPKNILHVVGEVLGSTPPPVVPAVPEEFDRDHLRLVADELARRVRQLEEEIDQRKLAEAALCAERDLSDSIINGLPGVFYLYDETGKFLRWNQNFETVAGYSANEIERLHPFDYFAGPDKQLLAERIAEVFRAGKAHMEADFVTKRGERIPYYFTGVRAEISGRPCLIGMGIDITDRRLAEDAARANETRFRRLFEQASDGIFVISADNRFLEANSRAVEMVGYTRDELLRMGVANILVPRERPRLDVEPALMMAGQPHLAEWEHLRKDGSTFVAEISAGKLTEGSYLAIVRDLTDRKRAAEALREGEERLRLALDAAHMGTFDWDVPQNRISWSRWHEELWGFTPGEFAGTYEAFAQRVHPDDLPGIDAEVAHCIAAREPFDREFRIVWPDGSVHWIVGRGEFTFGADGRPLRMRGVVVETTARKRAEEELAASRDRLGVLSRQLLEVQETERRHLARELHDEIGQVLTLIKIKASVASRHVTGEGRAGLDELANVVETSIQQVRNLSLDLRPSILDDFGLEAALEWYVDRQSRGTQVAVCLDSDLGAARFPPEIETAGFRVVQEAVTNALRHAHARHVRVEARRGEGELQLTVRDDGMGFDVEAARGRAARGGSVGLLGMQERAELLGGRLSVTSVPDGGCEIRARFPLSGHPTTPGG